MHEIIQELQNKVSEARAGSMVTIGSDKYQLVDLPMIMNQALDLFTNPAFEIKNRVLYISVTKT